MPLDIETILESALRTRHLLVVDNGWTSCGASAEIVAAVMERAGPAAGIHVERIGFAPTTCPTSPWLEAGFYPNPGIIAAAAWRLARPQSAPWSPSPEQTKLAYQVEFKGPF
jgi:pyruvate/2-oxoglutarate/acetoin dehydrogenase E1 component